MEADALRIGFGNLKHIGQGQAQVIVSERTRREFASLTDLFARVELHQQTKLALAYGGALDCFGDRRRILTGLQMEKPEPGILGELALLEKEKEIVGIYLSGPVHRGKVFSMGLRLAWAVTKQVISGMYGKLTGSVLASLPAIGSGVDLCCQLAATYGMILLGKGNW